ncbi:MAG TPA: hypothetical protein VF315_02715 [Steroidobacteraceae bacterium]
MTVNRKLQTTAVAALLACVTALGAVTAMAEHPAVPTCMDIHWNAELLKAFPRAPVACQEIAVRHGKNYARFTAKVTAVGADTVKVRFLNAAGDMEREISLKPGPDAKVTIAGEKVGYSKLQKDDVMTFWVPERQLGVISDPDATAASTIVLN